MPSKTTPVQQQRVEGLQAANDGQRIYTYPVNGKTITDQFRRYVTRQDASHIGKALYGFLTGVCGFIAEYGLIPPDGGFRIKWAEPAKLIHALPRECRFAAARRGHPERVYADGQTDVEVLAGIFTLAAEHNPDCLVGCAGREFDRDISTAIKLLERHRFTAVPPGWGLTATPNAPLPTRPLPESLAQRLAGLAEKHNLTLVAPPAVDADGQVRLL
jgi:hypothetical protein